MTIRVKFIRRVQYENEGRNKGPIFEKDSVYDFEDAFAQRWLRRGAAVRVDENTPLYTPEPQPEPDEEPRARGTSRRGR